MCKRPIKVVATSDQIFIAYNIDVFVINMICVVRYVRPYVAWHFYWSLANFNVFAADVVVASLFILPFARTCKIFWKQLFFNDAQMYLYKQLQKHGSFRAHSCLRILSTLALRALAYSHIVSLSTFSNILSLVSSISLANSFNQYQYCSQFEWILPLDSISGVISIAHEWNK